VRNSLLRDCRGDTSRCSWTRLDDNQVRQWYATQDAQHVWSRSVLRHHIDSGRHLRVGAADTTRKGANGALPGEWSDGGDVRCLWSLGALADGVGDLLILLKGAVAAAGDRGEVDEHVGAAAIRGDETESLLRVEPFDGALSHGVLQLLTGHPGGARAVARVIGGVGDGWASARCQPRPCPRRRGSGAAGADAAAGVDVADGVGDGVDGGAVGVGQNERVALAPQGQSAAEGDLGDRPAREGAGEGVSAAGGVCQMPPGEVDLAGGGVDQGDGFVTAVDPGGVGQRGQDDHVAGGVRARRSAGRVS